MTDPRALGVDGGLQLERTSQAWQRTALTLLVASLAAGRGLQDLFGVGAWGVAGVGVIAGVLLLMSAHRRYLAARRHLREVDAGSLPSGARTVLGAASFAALVAVAALLVVVSP